LAQASLAQAGLFKLPVLQNTTLLFTLMMIRIVIVILAGANGLRLTKPEPNDAHVQSTYMNVEPCRTLKTSNDILDEYIINYGSTHEFEREMNPHHHHHTSKDGASSKTQSMIESDGFFDEADELWEKRKQRHINQMSMQNVLMTTCPDELWTAEKKCMKGCNGKIEGCKGNVFWQAHYEPSFSCVLEERVGLQGEGGKWVCDPHKIRAQEKCLVYSVGSHGQYDFEKAVHENISSKCEIHTVDMLDWKNYTSTPPPEYVAYHTHKIGPAPDTPINALVTTLGHAGREIDIFKIDCEGCEWASYKSWFGAGVHIRQVLVEFHWTTGKHRVHELFNALFDLGYVVFHKESNTLSCKGNCIEYAFVRLSPTFSRAKR